MKKWNEEKIETAILESKRILNLDRMPTRSDLESINRGDLANKISKTLGYYGWAEKLGFKLKNSETTNGKKAFGVWSISMNSCNTQA